VYSYILMSGPPVASVVFMALLSPDIKLISEM